MVSKNYIELKKAIPDLNNLLKEKKINFLTLEYPKLTKKPWKHLQTEKIPINKLKNHKGNYGILLGFNKENSDYWLGGIDIYGFKNSEKKLDKSTTINENEKELLKSIATEKAKDYTLKTRQDLFKILKGLKDVIIIETANKGNHLYYWTKKDFDNTFIDNIYYPEDYSIEELKNKSVTYPNKHIEHYTYGRQFVAPSSTIEDEITGKIKQYKFISRTEEIKEFFNNPKPKENILEEIKELIENNNLGFTYKEPETIKIIANTKNKTKTVVNTNINIANGLVKNKINNPEIREQLLNNIVKTGYTHGNMNNLGYILICNFRRHGLDEKETLNIFKELPIKDHDINKVKSWINDKYKINLNNTDFKKYAGLSALNKEIETLANPRQIKYLKDWFSNFFYDVINALKKKPESKNALIQLAEFVETEYNIIKTLTNKKPVYYYYDSENKTYKEINHYELGIVLFNDYGLRLPDNKYNTVLTSCQKLKKIDNNYIEFKDHYINIKSLEIISKKDKIILTNKKFYSYEHNNFFEYNPSVKLFNTGKNETLTEKKIKQITIPKNNQNYTDFYIDWLQRLGSNISLNHKIITGYLGGGNNAKSILNWFLFMIYNALYAGISPEQFKKDHTKQLFENRHSLAIDELDNDSFNGIMPNIKRFRGGGVPNTERNMYDPNYETNTDYAMLWLFCNIIPWIDLNDTAFIESLDILQLPNIFVDENLLNKYPNTYLKDRFLKDKLRKDYEGINWLLNISIKMYKEMINNNDWFLLNQTIDETLAIITKNDYLLNFIIRYTALDDYTETENKEIVNKYESWIKENNYKIKIPKDLASKMGKKLKEHYGNKLEKGKTTGNKTRYKLRLKSEVEVKKIIYEIEEGILGDDPYILNKLETDEKIIYNAIKKGFNTYNALNLEYPNIKIIEKLNNLENIGLISNNEQISLY